MTATGTTTATGGTEHMTDAVTDLPTIATGRAEHMMTVGLVL